ncbi:MAG: hypothetical protein JWO09_3399 [Bacteroidetes bacterium]|nr:hypothetical protein [Bacteroidota bacterium]
MKKLSIESKVAAGFILSLLIIILFSVNAFFGMRSLINENNRHRQMQVILKSVDEVQQQLMKATASCREYILSGSEKPYTSYNYSMNRVEKLLDVIKQQLNTGAYGRQEEEFSTCFRLLRKVNDEIILTRQKYSDSQALAILLNGKVAEYGNRIMASLQEIEDEQRTQALQAFENNIEAANRTISSFVLLVLSILVVLSIVYYCFEKDLTERKRVKAELHRMNETLENKVRLRTEALIKSSQKYRFLADNIMDVITLHARDGSYTYISESCRNMSGYDPQELIGGTGYDYIHPEDLPRVQQAHRNLLSGKPDTNAVNFRFRKKSGEYFWVESIANVVKDATGRFESIIACTRDISGRVKTEHALKEHQQMLQGILDNTQNIIFIRSLNGEYLLVNRQFEKHFALVDSTEEVSKGKRMEEILPVEMLHKERQRDHEIVSANKGVEFEMQLAVNNVMKDYSFTKFPLYDDRSQVYAICGIGTDITQHKLAQKEISDSKAKLLALLQNSSDPIWSVNRDLSVMDFNASCSAMLSKFYGSSISISMNVLELSDSHSLDEWQRHYIRALSGEYFSMEMKLMYKMEDHYYDVSFNPILINARVEGVAVFARDITSRKKAERQLRYKVNELNTFMYKATHDLRAPLVSLMGLVHLAKGEAEVNNPGLANYFDMIGKSVNKMDKLLIDLVSITNVSQGKLMVNKVDFAKMTDDIMDSLSHYPNFDKIRVRKKFNADVPFYNDDKLLYSVMQNLIDNAIKYRRVSGSVESVISVIVECSEQSAVINIIDNGIGIEGHSQEKVFDMFYRAATISSGTGLGLYIVKTAVEKMGGKISLASKESEGTSIYITLPNLKV